MTIDVPYVLQAETAEHSAKLFRRMLSGLVQEGVGAFNDDGDLKVTPNSPAGMTVLVQSGGAYVQGDDTQDQGTYFVHSDATETIDIDAADETNPRKDLIVVHVYDETEGQTGDEALIEVVAGTPAASPSEPTLPDTALLLAVVDVPANATSITSSEITDRRLGVGGGFGTGARTDLVGTAQNRTSSAYGNLSTVGPSVEVVVGPSGLLLVFLYAFINNSGSGFSHMSFEISGANTQAPAHSFSVAAQSVGQRASAIFLLTGLNPGTTILTAKYRVASGTGTWNDRRITAIPF